MTKHTVKQVDRLMSNASIDMWDSFACRVPHRVGARREILVAIDWTDFDRDEQSTLVLRVVNDHDRAAPLIWLTVWKEEIATQRNYFEDDCLGRPAETLPAGCRVTILADLGFGDQKLFAFLDRIGFGDVVRFRGSITVTDADGTGKSAADRAGRGGRARKLRDARVTAKGQQVGSVVYVHAKGMKEPSRAPRVLPPEDRFPMVPGGERSGGADGGAGQPLRPPLDHRAAVPRHRGSALRHGVVGHPRRRSDAA